MHFYSDITNIHSSVIQKNSISYFEKLILFMEASHRKQKQTDDDKTIHPMVINCF